MLKFGLLILISALLQASVCKYLLFCSISLPDIWPPGYQKKFLEWLQKNMYYKTFYARNLQIFVIS
jgi:hypothetical protein